MLRVQPSNVATVPAGRTAAVLFTVPERGELAVDIPVQHAAAVRAALLKRTAPTARDRWSMAGFLDGQLTEVLVEVSGARVRFFVVSVVDGTVWPVPVDPVDAILTGLQLDLPFLLVGPALAERADPSSGRATAHPWPARRAGFADNR